MIRGVARGVVLLKRLVVAARGKQAEAGVTALMKNLV